MSLGRVRQKLLKVGMLSISPGLFPAVLQSFLPENVYSFGFVVWIPGKIIKQTQRFRDNVSYQILDPLTHNLSNRAKIY